VVRGGGSVHKSATRHVITRTAFIIAKRKRPPSVLLATLDVRVIVSKRALLERITLLVYAVLLTGFRSVLPQNEYAFKLDVVNDQQVALVGKVSLDPVSLFGESEPCISERQ
jgi:hypothetical protein